MLHRVVLTSLNKLTSCRRQRGNSREEGFRDRGTVGSLGGEEERGMPKADWLEFGRTLMTQDVAFL